MSSKLYFVTVLLSLVCLPTDAGRLQRLWRKAEKAESRGLPQTAIEKLDRIAERAKKRGESGQYLSALIRKTTLEASLHDEFNESRIRLLETEIESIEGDARLIAQGVLARWYINWIESARYRISRRTETVDSATVDFTALSIPRLQDRIDSLYTTILAQKDDLSQIPIGKHPGLLQFGSMPSRIRPHMYDVLVYEAIDFYSNLKEDDVSVDSFITDDQSGAFGSTTEFTAYDLPSPPTSPTAKILSLFQKLIRSQLVRGYPEAALDTDLHRLQFVMSRSSKANRKKIYMTRLDEILKSHPTGHLYALVSFELAQAWKDSGDFITAHRIAERGHERFPESVGGCRCLELCREFESKRLRVNARRSWTDTVTFDISYKNHSSIHFKAVKHDWRPDTGGSHTDDTVPFVRRDGITWSTNLKPTLDYKVRSVTTQSPTLPVGYYRVFASPDTAVFDSASSHMDVWVSRIAILTHDERKGHGGLVVDVETGEPLTNASVSSVVMDTARQVDIYSENTDHNGSFEFTEYPGRSSIRGITLHAKLGKDEIAQAKRWYPRRTHREHRGEKTVLFTDRFLYRPGQTVHYKGICLSIDHNTDSYQTISERKVSVTLSSPDGRTVSSNNAVSNGFGSFSGSFKVPEEGITGAMRISCQNPSGSCEIRLEEYKRPTFEVKLWTVKPAHHIGEAVTIMGMVREFGHAPVGKSVVRYRIERHGRNAGHETVYVDTLTAQADGSFQIQFKPKAHTKETSDGFSAQTLTIFAEVTAPDGETHQARHVTKLGRQLCTFDALVLNTPREGTPTRLLIKATGYYKENECTEARLVINRLQQPSRIPTKDDSDNPFGLDWKTWPREDSVHQIPVRQLPGSSDTVELNLLSGMYTVDMVNNDKQETLEQFIVFPSRSESTFPLKLPSIVHLSENTASVGDTVVVLWGSGYDVTRACVEIVQGDTVVDRYWTPKGSTLHQFSIPVRASFRGGFTISVSHMAEGIFYPTNHHVSVPWANKNLDLELTTFRDKLKPGQEETWTIRVNSDSDTRTPVELAASLYDYSLDKIHPHYWSRWDIFRHSRSRRSYDFSVHRSTLSKRDYGEVCCAFLSYPGLGTSIGSKRFHISDEWHGYAHLREFFRRRRLGISGMKHDTAYYRDPCVDDLIGSLMGGEGGSLALRERGSLRVRSQPEEEFRDDFGETAFFHPHLVPDSTGSASFRFSVPEALTTWKLLVFAHDTLCRNGVLTAFTTTQKELMVRPTSPRFLREGDTLYFTARVSNLSNTVQKGTVTLRLHDLYTDSLVDSMFGNATETLPFQIPSSTKVPAGIRVSKVLRYYLDRASVGWLQLEHPLFLAKLALAHHRMGDRSTARAILASLLERGAFDPEMGMHLPEVTRPFRYSAPTRTHTLLIEAFEEIGRHGSEVEMCKTWLLKQKQTQHWKSGMCTADAVFALLHRGRNLLHDSHPVHVSLGDTTVQPDEREAGTGYFEWTLPGHLIDTGYGSITLKSRNEGSAWGGVHLQYFEEVSQVTAHGNGLEIQSEHFLLRDANRESRLIPISGTVSPGEIIVTKMTLRVDRDMEYVHLECPRGSGLETTENLSGYRYQDGIRYYLSVRDIGSHFFIDKLQKGTYVLESRSRAV